MKHGYSVVLLRPDYVCDNPWDSTTSTYLAHVVETDPKRALKEAQRQAMRVDQSQDVSPDGADYTMLFMAEGLHDDIKYRAL